MPKYNQRSSLLLKKRSKIIFERSEFGCSLNQITTAVSGIQGALLLRPGSFVHFEYIVTFVLNIPNRLSSTCEKFEKDGGMYNAVQDIHEVERSEDEQQQTTHAIVAKRMKSRITDQEQELVAEKPWALRGEVHSGNRPQNR